MPEEQFDALAGDNRDDIAARIRRARAEEQKKEFEDIAKRAKYLEAIQAQQAAEQEASATAPTESVATAPKPAAAPAGESGGIVDSIAGGVGDKISQVPQLLLGAIGGVRDGTVAIGQTLSDIALQVAAPGSGPAPSLDKALPDVPDATGAGGAIVKPLAQFGTGFVPAVAALRGVSIGRNLLSALRSGEGFIGALGKVAAGSLEYSGASAVSAFSAFDPHAERLSNLAADNGIKPWLVQQLMAEPDDGVFEGRFKNAVEDFLIGGGLGGGAAAIGIALRFNRATAKVVAEAALDTAPTAIEPLTAAVRDVQFTREHLATVEGAEEMLRGGSDGTPNGLVSELDTLDPVAARDVGEFADQGDLDNVLDEAIQASNEAEAAFEEILRASDASPKTINRFNDLLDQHDPSKLEELRAGIPAEGKVRSVNEAQQAKLLDKAIARERKTRSTERTARGKGRKKAVTERGAAKAAAAINPELVQAAHPVTSASGFETAVRTSDGKVHLGKGTHANVVEANDLADDAAAEMGFVRDGVFHSRDDATDLIRAELGKGPRARADEPQVPALNGMSATARQLDSLKADVMSGNVDRAADTLKDFITEKSYAKLADEEGLRKTVLAVAQLTEGAAPESVAQTVARSVRLLAQDAEASGVPIAKLRARMEKLFPETKDIGAAVNAFHLTELALDAKVHEIADKIRAGQATMVEKAQFVRLSASLLDLSDLRTGVNDGKPARAKTAVPRAERDAAAAGTVQEAGGDDQLVQVANALHQSTRSTRNTRHVLSLGMQGQGPRGPAVPARAGGGGGGGGQLRPRGHSANLAARMASDLAVGAAFSNPVTWLKNFIGGVSNTLYLPSARMVGGAVLQNRHAINGAARSYGGIIRSLETSLWGTARGRAIAWQATKLGARGEFRKAHNLVESNPDGVPTAFTALATGDTPSAPGAAQYSLRMPGQPESWSSESLRHAKGMLGSRLAKLVRNPDAMFSKFVDAIGTVLVTPAFRALAVGDEIAKAANRAGKLFQRAYDKGIDAGLTGAQLETFINTSVADVKLHSNPAIAMSPARRQQLRELDEESIEFARFASWTDELPTHSIGGGLKDIIDGHPLLRLLFMAFRTPYNLVRYAVKDHSVLGMLKGEMLEKLMSGDPDTLGRMTIGTGFSAMAVKWAMEGRITNGGAFSPEERESLRLAGIEPYSFVMPQEDGTEAFINFDWIEPFVGTHLAAAADFADFHGRSGYSKDTPEATKLLLSISAAVAETAKRKSFVNDFVEIGDMLADPGRSAARFIGNTLGYISTPHANMVRAIQRSREGKMKQSDNRNFTLRMMSALEATGAGPGKDATMALLRTITGERRRLESEEPVLDLFVEEQSYVTGTGPDVMSLVYSRKKSQDLVRNTIADLSMSSEADKAAPINRTRLFGSIRAPGGSVNLSPSQINKYMRLTNDLGDGYTLHQQLEALFTSPDWKLMTGPVTDPETGTFRGDKIDKIMGIITQRTGIARGLLIAGDKELSDTIEAKKTFEMGRRADTLSKAKATQKREKDALGILTQGEPANVEKIKELTQLLGSN